MEIPNVTEREIMIKIENQQLEFLEGKAKELGLSKDELIKQYITKAITDESKKFQREQRLALINSVRGKYADSLSSSDDFAQRKQEEIQMER
jgi:hypothetical protein